MTTLQTKFSTAVLFVKLIPIISRPRAVVTHIQKESCVLLCYV